MYIHIASLFTFYLFITFLFQKFCEISICCLMYMRYVFLKFTQLVLVSGHGRLLSYYLRKTARSGGIDKVPRFDGPRKRLLRFLHRLHSHLRFRAAASRSSILQ